MIEVIDDVLDENTFKLIYGLISDDYFLWRWTPGTIDMMMGADTPQMVRPIFLADSKKSAPENDIINRWPEFYNIAVKALEKSERKWIFDSLKFHRIKANLLMPWPNAPRFHPPHTDTDADGAVSCIFYLHDSDGDTFFHGKDYRQVTPKANRAVLFDAYHKHCSSNPINTHRRMIINSVAFVDEEK